MTPEDIYNAVKDLIPYQVKKWYIDNNITEQQKKAYQNFRNVKRVLASREKNKEGYNKYQNDLMKEKRDADRKADNEKQKKYNKTYRDKIKKEEADVKKKQENINDVKDILNGIIDDVVDKAEKNKAVQTIGNAIKRKMAVKVLNNKKMVKTLQDKIKVVFNKPKKDETPKEKLRRENRERVRRWRANKKAEQNKQ